MSQLPNCKKAIVQPEKLVKYLLNFAHPKGRSKAHFFSRFGYELGNFDEMAKALLQLACAGKVVEIEETEFGNSFNVRGNLLTSDLRNPIINSIWMIETGSTSPRFISIQSCTQPTPFH